jgi:CRISPR-associated Csx14 family protein
MPSVFVATLGQRPEAITIALDLLRERDPIDTVVIIHTDKHASAIASAYDRLHAVMMRDYAELNVIYREVRRSDGHSLHDIIDYQTASDYFRDIYRTLLEYKQGGNRLHVLIAGGRKSMTVYAALAAALIFSREDNLWHVVSPDHLIMPEHFHVSPELREQVYLIDMPIVPARIAYWGMPSSSLDDPLELVKRLQDTRQTLLNKLSPEERRLVDVLLQHPEWTDKQIAAHLHKSPNTVSNQFGWIYNKMDIIDPDEATKGKRQRNPKLRQILMKVLRGEL